QVEEAVRIIEATRARYDGTKQNPWNDIECGDHYVRAMASWALLEAASGFDYDAGTATIGFAPVLSADDYRAPFVTRDGWGTFSQRVGATSHEVSLRVAWGHLELGQLRLRLQGRVRSAVASLAGAELAVAWEAGGRDVTLDFDETVRIDAGQEMTVRLRYS
ncbi:MAG TPA: hypothetical protein VHG52_15420, partial [Thermomicrobiales bacterium]|nr:hypothetical protein [Thermomicrobiales bacterium]